jgi:hypothetical protein
MHNPLQIEKLAYKGWPNSYRVSNGAVELVITGDIGPRIMRYGFVGSQNFFKEFPEGLGRSGEPTWQLRGGHRIWVATEDPYLTYAPDNGPVEIVVKGDVIEATQPVEPTTGLVKQLVVKMAPSGTGVEILHRIRNQGRWTVEIAPWAVTMLAPGGVGITGFPPRGTHPEVLNPTHPLVMWAFTDLADPRWKLTRKYMILRQDPQVASPQKLGHFNPHTWSAYLLGSDLFLKRHEADPARAYPDLGCSFETFTNDQVLEQETLGPLARLPYGATLEHIETWTLHRDIHITDWSDEALDEVLLPLVGA